MAKRNIIKKIQGVKSRSAFYSRYDYVNRLDDIENAVQKFSTYNSDLNRELRRYIPIATIACFQAFFLVNR